MRIKTKKKHELIKLIFYKQKKKDKSKGKRIIKLENCKE